MGPKRKSSKGADELPPKRQRKAPAQLYEDYVTEERVVRTKSAPAPTPKKSTPSPKATPAPKVVPKSRAAPTPKESPVAESVPTIKAPSKRKTAALPSTPSTVSTPSSSSSSSSSSLASSVSTAASTTSVSILAIWAQVWKALAVSLLCTFATFAGNYAFEVMHKSNKKVSLAAVAVKMGNVMLWVVASVCLPFVAVSVIVTIINVAQSNNKTSQGITAAVIAAVFALSAHYYLQSSA